MDVDDALVADLDVVDRSVRDLYRRLADDPDLAAQHEAVLRELHAKRTELSHQVGMAALARWRAARVVLETTATEGPSADAAEPPATGVASEALIAEPPATHAEEPAVEATPPATAAPPPIEPAPVPIPPAPASDAQLAAFKSVVQAKGLGATALPTPSSTPSPSVQKPWPITLHELMCLLGPRETDLDDAVALVEELDALDEVATRERQLQWVRFPIEVQKHWLSHLVARTRAMRDHPSSEGVLDRLKKIRAVYPQWAREFVPGHVNGLQLKHMPINGSWADDADEHWQALVEIVGQEVPQARKVPPTRKKKERAVVEEEPAVVEPDWPLLPITRGKTAVIVGGAPKEPNRDRLETFLRLATLEWPVIDGPRKVEAVAQRIAKGTYDVVLIVQAHISHPEAERILAAAKASRTRWAMAEGYGATAVRQGLERFLKPAS